MSLSKLTIYSAPILVASCPWHWNILASTGSARAVRNVKPLWRSWREKRERGGPGLLKTCGYASVIMAMDSWELPNQNGGLISSPGKENGQFSIASFDYWRIHSDEIVFSIVGLLTLPHGVELASTLGLKLRSVKGWCQVTCETKWIFLSEWWLCSSVGSQCNTVQSLCVILERFSHSKKNVDACPRWTWFKNVIKTSNHFERSGADQVSLSQHSRNPTGWLADSLFSLWLFMMQFAAQKFW